MQVAGDKSATPISRVPARRRASCRSRRTGRRRVPAVREEFDHVLRERDGGRRLAGAWRACASARMNARREARGPPAPCQFIRASRAQSHASLASRCRGFSPLHKGDYGGASSASVYRRPRAGHRRGGLRRPYAFARPRAAIMSDAMRSEDRESYGNGGASGDGYPQCPSRGGAGRVPTKYHDILDIPLGVSSEEVTRAFRRKAMQHHPDRNKAPDATARMQEVSEARSLLFGSESIRAGAECALCGGRGAAYAGQSQGRGARGLARLHLREGLLGGGWLDGWRNGASATMRVGVGLRRGLLLLVRQQICYSEANARLAGACYG